MKSISSCSVADCDRPAWQKGFCSMHYRRQWKHGTTDPVGTPKGEPQAFLRAAAMADHDECIEWPYSKTPNGYGSVWFGGAVVGAHIASCTLRHGPKPSDDMEVAHSCRQNRACINGNHVRWSTHVDNEADKQAHGTRTRGEAHGATKFTEEMVRAVRAAVEKGDKSQAQIAREFGMSQMNVSSIKLRKIWGWLP